MGRHPFLGSQIAAEGRERAPFLHVPGRVTAGLTEERMEDFRVADANDRRAIGIDAEQTHEPDRFGGRRFARRLVPFDLREVGSDDGNFVPTGEIQERRPWQEPGIQPHRAIGHEEIETGRTQKIATHSAASSAARGEHRRKKSEPYMSGDRTERWIAETAAHEFLGYLILGESGFMTPEAQGFIYDVWVTPTRRGEGVGKFLVEWASDWARQRGYRKIKLEVSETNARARHVYESLGFRAERRYMGKLLG